MARPKVHDSVLRIRLLEAAGMLLTAEGPDALSLRRLAAEAGTSTTAVYSLFGGKPGVCRALFIEAVTKFAAHLDAVEPSGDPLADIVALGHAYRALATAHPHLYTVMFGSPVRGFVPAAEDWERAEATLAPLLDAVRRGVAAGLLRRVELGLLVTALWACVHGVVSLELGRAMPAQAEHPAETLDAAIRATLDGWQATPVVPAQATFGQVVRGAIVPASLLRNSRTCQHSDSVVREITGSVKPILSA